LGLAHDDRPIDCASGCALLRAIAPDDPLGIEVSRDTSSGRRQPLLVNAAAINDADGVVVQVVHSIRDVTRLKEAEEAKTLFLATASHELKTPLTVIRGFVEMLADDLSEEIRPVALAAVHRRTIELSAIVDRLLLSSRIEAGRVNLAIEAIDVVSIATERVLAMSSATGRSIALRADGALPQVRGNTAAFATVLDHLLDNAVKYSPEGGEVLVTVERRDDAVVLAVADEGIGMDDEQLAHCFDKFWQAETSDVRRFGGTGIGLYIVRSLTEAMGGGVEVDATDGGGTVFRVVLQRPLVDEAAPSRGEPTMIEEFMRQIVPGGGS
jgi:signal transduction histidine kinase